MIKNMLLTAIRVYWRAVPMGVRGVMTQGRTGTSVAAYEKISAGSGTGLGTFIRAAMPYTSLAQLMPYPKGPWQ